VVVVAVDDNGVFCLIPSFVGNVEMVAFVVGNVIAFAMIEVDV
jgi:hypothetical protein